MITKTLSQSALSVIDGYSSLKVGGAAASVPYFNNKVSKKRASLRAYVGKGSTKDIEEEVSTALVKQHIDIGALTSETLKKVLVDNGLGIDCSGFAYYILDAESRARGLGHMNKHLTFIKRYGPVGKMMCYLRPAENCDVKTFASDMSSRAITLKDIQPGDFISMLGTTQSSDRDHILVVTKVNSEDDVLKSIDYSHAIAYPEDGVYGSGMKNGVIEIASPLESITAQVWSEDGSTEKARALFDRALASKTELRRLKWFS